MARLTAMDVTILSIAATDVLAYFETADLNFENQDEDGRGAIQRYSDACVVGSSWTLEVETFVNSTEGAALLAKARGANPTGVVNFNLDGDPLTGTVLISTVGVKIGRGALTKQRIMLKCKGELADAV